MLEYYKLALVSAGENRRLFRKQLKKALIELDSPSERDALRAWFKQRLTLPNGQ